MELVYGPTTVLKTHYPRVAAKRRLPRSVGKSRPIHLFVTIVNTDCERKKFRFSVNIAIILEHLYRCWCSSFLRSPLPVDVVLILSHARALFAGSFLFRIETEHVARASYYFSASSCS